MYNCNLRIGVGCGNRHYVMFIASTGAPDNVYCVAIIIGKPFSCYCHIVTQPPNIIIIKSVESKCLAQFVGAAIGKM